MESETPPVAAEELGEIAEPERAFNKPNSLALQMSRKDFPPGLVGDVAWHIYIGSPLPVYEYALGAAFAVFAGIFGRCYNVLGLGLNLYILIIGETGTGKTSTVSLIQKLVSAIQKDVHSVTDFFTGDFASAEGMHQKLADQYSIVCLYGEIGHFFKQLLDLRAPSHILAQARFLLNVYSQSGRHGVVRPRSYSDQGKSKPLVKRPALSMCGDGIGHKLFQAMNADTFDDGTGPRFTYFENKAPIGNFNSNFQDADFIPLAKQLAPLVSQALSLNSRDEICEVRLSQEAAEQFASVEIEAKGLAGKGSEFSKQMWTRWRENSLKLAAIIAIGIDPWNPIIDGNTARNCIDLVRGQINNVISKFASGEIGSPDENETLREKCVVDEIAAYCRSEYDLKKYVGTTRAMHEYRVISERFLQQRFASKACFKRARIGATAALKKTLENMCRNGLLKNCPPHTSEKMFHKATQSYQVFDSKAFGLEPTNAFEGMFDDASLKPDAI